MEVQDILYFAQIIINLPSIQLVSLITKTFLLKCLHCENCVPKLLNKNKLFACIISLLQFTSWILTCNKKLLWERWIWLIFYWEQE
jgi:hypothetical protein